MRKDNPFWLVPRLWKNPDWFLSTVAAARHRAYRVERQESRRNEAKIVALAGRLGSVTVSTNMAGRGTDIKLGGDPEMMAQMECPLEDPIIQKYLLDIKRSVTKKKPKCWQQVGCTSWERNWL